MNCRDAESLIFAARDGALDESRRAALAEHLGQCPACRAVKVDLDATATAWRAADAAATLPAVEVEWHAIRRRIRGEAPAAAPKTAPWQTSLGWVVAGLAAVLALFLSPRLFQTDPPAATPGYVSYVVVENTSAETMVFEDEQSGWLVVWLTDDPARSGT